MNNPALKESATALLRQAGFGGPFELVQLKGGGNNRVFQVTLPDRAFLLKAYFRHEQDPRDRLGAEFSFCRFAWDHGLRCIPQPIACDRQAGIGLYEFIPGHRPRADQVNGVAVENALHFFTELNRHRSEPAAASLPIASEACFSVEEHLQCIARRVKRLSGITGAGLTDQEAARFVADELNPTWARVSARIEPSPAKLSPAARRISPSDFGFHNTLFMPDGHIRFIDFEYSGWDDPAKTVCDFFCQVALPAPIDCLGHFANEATKDQSDPSLARERIRALLPVYQIKWCCIVLNDFLPADSARRRFSRGDADDQTRKRRQLDKAIELLRSVT